jgi:hypothetical protein
MTAQVEQRFFGRICRVTVKVTVFTSSTSAVSDPKSPIGPPQSGQAHSLGSIVLSIRLKCSGRCLRRVGCPFSGTAASGAADAKQVLRLLKCKRLANPTLPP